MKLREPVQINKDLLYFEKLLAEVSSLVITMPLNSTTAGEIQLVEVKQEGESKLGQKVGHRTKQKQDSSSKIWMVGNCGKYMYNHRMTSLQHSFLVILRVHWHALIFLILYLS